MNVFFNISIIPFNTISKKMSPIKKKNYLLYVNGNRHVNILTVCFACVISINGFEGIEIEEDKK